MTKIAGSGSASGSISQRHGSADPDPDPAPDPHQNIMGFATLLRRNTTFPTWRWSLVWVPAALRPTLPSLMFMLISAPSFASKWFAV